MQYKKLSQMKIFGELKGRTANKEIVKSPTVTIMDKLKIDIPFNDCPVTVFYKANNRNWKSILINNIYSDEAIPRYCELYLSSILTSNEKIEYSIEF